MKETVAKYTVIALLSLLTLGLSFFRPINTDEGYYVASGEMITEGEIPYRDFIFHQMPLSIYVYSFVSNLNFWSLVSGRILSVVMLILSFLIFSSIVRQEFSYKEYIVFVLMFFLNSFFIDWAVLIRIYSLSALLLSSGVYYFYRFSGDRKKSYYLFLSVFSFSLLVFTKITFIFNLLIVIFFVVFVMIRYDRKKLLGNVFITLLAAAGPFAVFILIFGKSYEELYFNVYHVNMIAKEHIDAPFTTNFVKFFRFFILPQNLIIITIISFSGFKYSLFEKFLIANVMGFVLVHIPSRMLMEYLSSVTPLIILLSSLRYKQFELNLSRIVRTLSSKRILVSVMLLYLISIPFGIVHLRYLLQGKELYMNPVQLYYFEQKVNSLNGQTVLSSWVGYSVFSDKQPILKDQYVPAYISKYLTDAEMCKFGVTTKNQYRNLILEKLPDIIIYDRSIIPSNTEGLEEIISSNYHKVFEYKSVSVFQR